MHARGSCREETVFFQSPEYTLVGSLAFPKERVEPIPGVVLLHGFTSDRDEAPIAGTGEAMFQRAEKEFNTAGIATLRFDFYGHGKSGGRFEELTLEILIADALAAVAHLSSRPEVASDRIGLLGQSMGGLVAACTAHRDTRIRSLVLWNAPAYPLYTWTLSLGSTAMRSVLHDGSVEFTWEDKGLFKLNRTFFDSLGRTSPLVEISKFDGSLLTIVGRDDETIYPQPLMGETLVHAHPGYHEIHMLDADHIFNVSSQGTELLDRAIHLTMDWLRREL